MQELIMHNTKHIDLVVMYVCIIYKDGIKLIIPNQLYPINFSLPNTKFLSLFAQN